MLETTLGSKVIASKVVFSIHWVESKNIVVVFKVPSGGPEFTGGRKEQLWELIISPEGYYHAGNYSVC